MSRQGSTPPGTREETSFTLGRFVRPYSGRLGIVLAIMIVSTFLGLLNPWFVQQLIDRILLARRPDLLWIFAAVIGGVAVTRFAMGVIQAWVYTGLTSRILFDMRRDFLGHLQGLSLRFFAERPFGDIITRFNRDLTQLQEIATGALLGFVTNVLTLVGVVVWALYYDPTLFLLAAVPFPLAMLIARLFRDRIHALTQRLRELASGLASIVVETITGIRTVRAHGRERSELKRFVSHGHRMIRSLLSFQLTRAFASGLPRLCLVAATVIVYVVGGRKVISGEMGLGSLVALSMYVGMVYAPLMSLVDLYLQIVQARVSMDRVREIRDLRPEVVEDPDAPAPGPVRGAIRFDDVSFRYRRGLVLLEDVGFSAEPGETLALVGVSGSGKSTIVDLLFRFLDPDTGTVSIDGQDLRSVRMRPLRDRMAVVTQDDFLFNASIEDNVRFGSRHATDEDVRAAIEATGIADIADSLPDGLDTLVGEQGRELSAGQRQRVSIARALLRRPAILILDEATSSLDASADRVVRDAIERMARSATTLIVTHRLTRLDAVDRILVLERGRIVEQGTPDALAAAGGRYRAMLDDERADRA